MIDWRINQKDGKQYSEKGWGFSSFEEQEYLMPILNIGLKFIDEYNDTIFSRDDCFRMIGNIDYTLDSRILTDRKSLKFDSFDRHQIVTLDTAQLVKTLRHLRDALSQAVELECTLVFYGD